MTGFRLTPLAASLPSTVPFVGPETQERQNGRPFRARLGANESIFGPSPRAIDAMERAARDIWKYGDSSSHDLRHALAHAQGVAPENVLVGEGIDGILGNLVRLTVAPGDHVVTSEGAYPTFNYHVAGFGGTLHKVPYVNDHEDPASLFEKAAQVGAKLVYLANPDNPMGTWHEGATLQKAIDAHLPEDCLLVLDEAYIEFAPKGTAPRIDPNDPRVIRTRTFSKIHGMAGARVGYAIGAPGLIGAFDKVRNHFGMNRAAQDGALAALQDADYVADIREKVAHARGRIAAIAQAHGLSALPSATNFVAVDMGGDHVLARAFLDALNARGVFIRMPGVVPLNRCVRISCGRDADLDVLEAEFGPALDAARQS
ncbi:pyridoxal phosphate-dependent aminotransferase [Lutimaribacter sp. EGI FJ00015]|uniref:Pyridoxal phosphate-dependent aminotransferase n=1 Tax=Lutimaribacter degradans TaxID=2945989 RepID=A0ACC5ZWK6_9RHOB|nr:pyridoxal phosphate-dependent aminotransferase [Lutimaribacter sp. EGI FJ00013]MCM2562338.1 pyridoxal phosphate-dependent aminotransferase [Lutimaribacter sp. EGI FJ00013]MCO0613493.1 pyridoxal phosphate-dependent aminotransferase [Lutimaribacter sp. EGI FJ00015]MCO0636467.1 pyridoxal phosphate-dependent aminotransferase [Lutimaribacter sp. EGI FJ00014]